MSAAPTDAAIEVAAKAMYEANDEFHVALAKARGRESTHPKASGNWETASDYHRDLYRMRAIAALSHPNTTGQARGVEKDWEYWESCSCVIDCYDCSNSGDWHQHSDDPCVAHPDAEMS